MTIIAHFLVLAIIGPYFVLGSNLTANHRVRRLIGNLKPVLSKTGDVVDDLLDKLGLSSDSEDESSETIVRQNIQRKGYNQNFARPRYPPKPPPRGKGPNAKQKMYPQRQNINNRGRNQPNRDKNKNHNQNAQNRPRGPQKDGKKGPKARK